MKKKKKVTLKKIKNKIFIGWNEWCSLPSLSLPAIKAKIDTGAKTSAIHAFNIRQTHEHGRDIVHFDIHPLQRNNKLVVHCHAPIFDQRSIMSSNGHIEHRYIIKTPIQLGEDVWEIEISLSNRDPLTYRMLLGREALAKRVVIDPAKRYKQGKLSKQELHALYAK